MGVSDHHHDDVEGGVNRESGDDYLRREFEPIASELWSHNAKWWQDGFTAGADPEYEEQILPIVAAWSEGRKKVVEIGTGEGQILRHLASIQDRELLIGFDPTLEQIAVANQRGIADYLQAGANEVPLASGSFDLAIACLVFEHIPDIDGALSEVYRLLEAGGSFLFLLNHPLFQTPDSGWVDDTSFGEQYWRVGRYLEERQNIEEVEKDVFIPFVHRTLSSYLNAAIAKGLILAKIYEPAPPQGFLELAPEYYEAQYIPRLLALHFVKGY